MGFSTSVYSTRTTPESRISQLTTLFLTGVQARAWSRVRAGGGVDDPAVLRVLGLIGALFGAFLIYLGIEVF